MVRDREVHDSRKLLQPPLMQLLDYLSATAGDVVREAVGVVNGKVSVELTSY